MQSYGAVSIGHDFRDGSIPRHCSVLTENKEGSGSVSSERFPAAFKCSFLDGYILKRICHSNGVGYFKRYLQSTFGMSQSRSLYISTSNASLLPPRVTNCCIHELLFNEKIKTWVTRNLSMLLVRNRESYTPVRMHLIIIWVI